MCSAQPLCTRYRLLRDKQPPSVLAPGHQAVVPLGANFTALAGLASKPVPQWPVGRATVLLSFPKPRHTPPSPRLATVQLPPNPKPMAQYLAAAPQAGSCSCPDSLPGWLAFCQTPWHRFWMWLLGPPLGTAPGACGVTSCGWDDSGFPPANNPLQPYQLPTMTQHLVTRKGGRINHTHDQAHPSSPCASLLDHPPGHTPPCRRQQASTWLHVRTKQNSLAAVQSQPVLHAASRGLIPVGSGIADRTCCSECTRNKPCT